MFCCARKQNHKGQIVAAICLEQECMKAKNQLACIMCLQEEHMGHSTTSMKKLVPELLDAHSDKLVSESKIDRLFQFVVNEFGYQFLSGEMTTKSNLIDRVEELLVSLKKEAESTGEEINKMKSIFRNLNKTTTSQVIPKQSQNIMKTAQSKYTESEHEEFAFKSNPSANLSPTKFTYASNKSKSLSPTPNLNGQKPEMDQFSIQSKHPYLHLSPDLRTVTKTSHSGHRFAVIGARPYTENDFELRLTIDKSLSGNLMIGVCHENLVREKEFANCYGINSGTYLIGQNGGNQTTAISFHNSLTVFNRKEIVGWNFQIGDEVIIGINFEEELVYFRRSGKKGNAEFSMKIKGDKVEASVAEMGLKLIVLLQSEGDQVSIIEQP